MTKVPLLTVFAAIWVAILVLGIAGVYGRGSELDNEMFGLFAGGVFGFFACIAAFYERFTR